jgi:site-specific DNA-methyltransferase (cytosine-N4-specific)
MSSYSERSSLLASRECGRTRFDYTFQLPNYFIQAFERELAKLELSSLANSEIIEYDGRFEVAQEKMLDENCLRKLAFFKDIVIKRDNIEDRLIPDQLLLEKLTPVIRRSKNKHDVSRLINSLNTLQVGRKESQYLTHSLHPYKGRFYPQMIRALINFARLKAGDTVLDPFCGCGTTLLECFLTDINSVGIDLHPLACFIAKVKIQSLNLNPAKLRSEIKKLLRRIQTNNMRLQKLTLDSFLVRPQEFSDLQPLPDMPNIDKWFSPDVLVKIQVIMKNIDKIEDENVKDLFKVVLSSILRPISNWDTRQVRVRLLKEPRKNVPVFEIFEDKLWKSYFIILSYQKIKPKLSISGDADTKVVNADSRRLEFVDSESIDAIITSPPYAMALPYIDTDRLSLFLLGYVTRKTINDLIFRMIGNREISDEVRKKWEREFLEKYDELAFPVYFKKTLSKIIQENKELPNTAFRRKNMPALLFKYFYDMQLCLNEMDRVLKPDKHCIVIVGNNYTTTGKGNVVNIETDRVLSDMAVSNGWSLIKRIVKELTPTSPPPLSKIRYESVLIFRKNR